jgi:hypothetical protein
VAPRPAGGRVLATPGGEFWQATAFQEPTACAGREGDCLAAVRAFDGIERFSRADSTDLARRETIELTFPGDLGDRTGLVLASRQTLLSTFLFYQTLAYMGRDVGSWIATLERGGAGIQKRSKGIGDALGGIEILAADPGGRWRRVAEVRETGPLATDVRVVPLPRSGSGPLHVCLRLTRGLWRLDYLALARLDAPVRPIAIEPSGVVKDDVEDREALGSLLDPARVLTTFPGDRYTLSFRLPDEPDRCEIFLESRGYYLEWMREEWLPERNPSLAMAMFRNPRKALHTLAPGFKRIEAGMEEDFWRSRYVHP